MKKLMMMVAVVLAAVWNVCRAELNPPVSYLSPVFKIPGDPKSGQLYMETNWVSDYAFVQSSDNPGVVWGEPGKTTWYVADGDLVITNGTEQEADSIVVSGDVRLVLKDGCDLKVFGGWRGAAICVCGPTNAFTVYAQSTNEVMGRLRAEVGTGLGWGSAGIGGSLLHLHADSENITINGGSITARGGQYGGGGGGAGVGSTYCASARNIFINGGEVVAMGAGAGIGTGGTRYSGEGYLYSCRNVVITGGRIMATGERGAGIGGGGSGSGAPCGLFDFVMTGGDVRAVGLRGAGIGGGSGSNGDGRGGACSNVVISGGILYARGGDNTADPGIGGGHAEKGGACMDILIAGGSVRSLGGTFGTNGGAGIGVAGCCEYYRGDVRNVRITGGCVFASGGSNASGIGDGASSGDARKIEEVFVSTALSIKADGNNPPTTVIANDGGDLATALAGKRYFLAAKEIGPGGGEEPGSGEIPAGGISKYDATYIYDGEGHTINTQALFAVTLAGATPNFSFSLNENGPWQMEPFVYTNAVATSFWYRISAQGYYDFVHAAKVTITNSPVVVKNVTIRQVKPWQGMVEVDYELTEDCSSAANPATSIVFTDILTGKSYTAKTFTHPFTYTKGKKRMIWNAVKDGVSFKSSDVACKVSVTTDASGSEGLYCVVDLSGGTSATFYPVTYLTSAPAGGWTEEYKTTKLVLRCLNAGTFTMGSPSDELGRGDNETQHQVTLTRGFYIGVFEVTQRQWELVMGTRPSYFKNDAYYASRPVEIVSYDMIRGSSAGSQWPASNAVDADSFLGKIRAKTGLLLDLPTEAQWEYACRAGTTTALNSGKNLTSGGSEMDEVGRYFGNGGDDGAGAPESRPSDGTAYVGSYVSNGWGLYDMHGNVREWCLDWYGNLDTMAVTNPVGAATGSYRSCRGGSWFDDSPACRSANRAGSRPSPPSADLRFRNGFRLASSVESFSTSTALDLTVGPVAYSLLQAETMPVEFGSLYGDAEDGTAQFRVNGEILAAGGTAAVMGWKPTAAGTYVLEHRMDKNGSALGTTLTVTHNVSASSAVVTIKGHTRTVTYDGSQKTVSGYDVVSISEPGYSVNDFTFSGTQTVIGTEAGTYPMGLKANDFVNTNGNFSTVMFVVTDGWLKILPDEVQKAIGGAGKAEKTEDGWRITLTNDAQSIVFPSDMGNAIFDLAGRSIVGADGAAGTATTAGGDGSAALSFGPGTVMTLTNSSPDRAFVTGGRGGDGCPAGDGGPGVWCAVGSIVNVGPNIAIVGGAGGNDLSGTGDGGDGGAGVEGDVGNNDGDITGGKGGSSENGKGGDGGDGTTGEVGGGSGDSTGGAGGESTHGQGGKGGRDVGGYLVVDDSHASFVGIYDGTAHGIDIDVLWPESGYEIRYARSEAGPYVLERPLYTNVADCVTNWYEVSMPRCSPVRGCATVTITNRPVTVTSGTKIDFIYDGQPHDYPHATIGGMGLVEGEDFVFSNWATVTSTKEGPVRNTFDISPSAGTDLANYAITVVYGVLAVINEPPPPGKFVVVFDANGGKVNEFFRFVSEGQPVGELPEAERMGYDWNGWFTQVVGGEKVSAATSVTTNTVYHAQWSEQKIPVTWIEKPTLAADPFTYDGLGHAVATDVDGRLSVAGTLVATNAGEYGVAFVLPSQTLEMLYAWTDGSTDPVAVTWSIAPRPIADAAVTVEGIADQTYVAGPIEPDVEVSFGGVALVMPDDYTVAYSNNVAVGTGYAIVTGAGNFSGERTVAFRIVPLAETVGAYLSFDLEDDLGVVIDADYRAGDSVSVKIEGIAKGLKIVKDGNGAWILSGVPTETTLYATQPMFARVTVTYKDKTKGVGGKSETLQLLPLEITAAETRTLAPAGILNGLYEPIAIADLWPEVADAAVHPKDWSIKGWPTGILYNNTDKPKTWKGKVGGMSVERIVDPYEVYGVPTKAGTFALTATYKYKPTGATAAVSETESATMTVWADAEEQAYRYTDRVGVETTVTTLGADVKTATGLPTGLRFAKGVVSGTPTKAGVFAVTLTMNDKSKETFLWFVEKGVNEGVLARIGWEAKDSAVTVMQGVIQNWGVDLPAGAKVTVTGLPAGLTFKQDAKTKLWTFGGTPTKEGNYVVTFKTVLNGETVTERIAIAVEANAWTGNWYGVQRDSHTDSSLNATITVSASGAVSMKLAEGILKTTAKTTVTAKNINNDGHTVTLNVMKGKEILRTFTADFAAGTFAIGETVVADLCEPTLSLAADKSIGTFVLEEVVDGETNACAYVTTKYDAKRNSYTLAGKLWDGTSVVGTAYPLTKETADGGHVLSPVLLTDKTKNAVYLELSDDGSHARVLENGEKVEIGKDGMTPWSQQYPEDAFKGATFASAVDAETCVVLAGAEEVAIDLSQKDRGTKLAANGLVKFALTDVYGWKWACEMLPVDNGGTQFRGIATGTKRGEPTQYAPVWSR